MSWNVLALTFPRAPMMFMRAPHSGSVAARSMLHTQRARMFSFAIFAFEGFLGAVGLMCLQGRVSDVRIQNKWLQKHTFKSICLTDSSHSLHFTSVCGQTCMSLSFLHTSCKQPSLHGTKANGQSFFICASRSCRWQVYEHPADSLEHLTSNSSTNLENEDP